jgi:hypothetical protein
MPTLTDQKARWRALIQELTLPSIDLEYLNHTLDRIDPSHGLRAAMVSPLRQQIVDRAPDQLPHYDAFESNLPKVGFFSFMPLIEVGVRYFKAAQILHPTQTLVSAVNQLVYDDATTLKTAPFMQAMIRAADNDVRGFLRGMNGSSHMVENYGSREVDIDQPGHFRMLYRDFYPYFAMYYLEGSARAWLNWFVGHGEAFFERLSDTDCTIDIRW